MKKTHVIVIAIVVLLIASLAFAQQNSVTYGAVAAAQTPAGVVVEGEDITYTLPTTQTHRSATSAHKAAAHHATAVQHSASQQATHAANEAVLKQGEPTLKVNTTTTTTDVYDVRVKNNKGITNYGVAEQTVTNPKGKKNTEGIVYATYQPSKTAQANAKGMEISLAAGETISYNKDDRNDRYATNGLAADISILKSMGSHLALGLDYAMLHPRGKTHDDRHYHGLYTHNISLAGKLTVNPFDMFQVYMPMGVGMANARIKSVTDTLNTSENKWGASFYAGLGVQYDITCWMFAGLEYRYNYAFISDKDLTPFHKDRNLQFHTAMMRVGMRF
ncbi:MAG: porin family protein [Elusimicrobiaceae bacterium]|nr:porin family protein [Elusimicrobiaceae bacterium]